MRAGLITGVNVDRLDIAAGMRELVACGYPATETERHYVIEHALMRWARGEEEAAQRGAIDGAFHGIDLTSWIRVLASAQAAAQVAPTTPKENAMTTHELKTDPEVFAAVLSGAKTHEIRLNDRGYAVGDELVLRETVHTGAEMASSAPLEYTGHAVTRIVSHIQTGYGLADDWCILSFAAPAKPLYLGVDFSTEYLHEREAALLEQAGQLVENAGFGSPRSVTAAKIRALKVDPPDIAGQKLETALELVRAVRGFRGTGKGAYSVLTCALQEMAGLVPGAISMPKPPAVASITADRRFMDLFSAVVIASTDAAYIETFNQLVRHLDGQNARHQQSIQNLMRLNERLAEMAASAPGNQSSIAVADMLAGTLRRDSSSQVDPSMALAPIPPTKSE